jgi:hypothetical protein
LPLAWRGTSCGHDFDFHMQSWLETVQHWREGVLYPRWDLSANYGAGEPRFVFYPPITWLLGGLLGTLLPWSWTPVAFTLLAFLACGLSFFKMAREWTPEDAASVAACVYLLNPYLLFVTYERSAYGELLSAIWLPLLVLYGLRKQPSLLQLSLVIAALWLTNAPSAVMGCYFLALIVFLAAVRERNIMLVFRAAGAVALGLGLAAFYIVPAVYEQRWVEIARAIGSGMRVEDSFLFGHTGDAFHDHVLRSASWIAIVMLVATVIALWFSRKSAFSRASATQKDRASAPDILRFLMTATTLVILFLLVPLSSFIWHHTPELKFLQFPWRWLLVLSVSMAALIGLALRGSFFEAKTRRTILTRAMTMLALAVVMASIAAFLFWQPCDDEDNIATQRVTFSRGGFEGTDEYTAANTDNSEIQQGLPLVRVLKSADTNVADSAVAENPEWQPDSADAVPADLQILSWKAENKQIEINTSAAAYAVLKLVDYPVWHVTINGTTITARPHRDDGLIAIPLQPGRSFITIRYEATRDVQLGRALSLLSLCIAIMLYLQTKRRRNHQVS